MVCLTTTWIIFTIYRKLYEERVNQAILGSSWSTSVTAVLACNPTVLTMMPALGHPRGWDAAREHLLSLPQAACSLALSLSCSLVFPFHLCLFPCLLSSLTLCLSSSLCLLMKVKEKNDKAGLKLNIQKTKIMASDPITSWQTDGETMETVTDSTFLGSKITADGDCNQDMKRHLLLGRKAMTSLDSILKSRDITLPTKVHLVKAMAFPVVTYGCESWAIKKAEHQRTDALELWCWRRLFWESLGQQGDQATPS